MAENSTMARIGLCAGNGPEAAAWEPAQVDRLPTVEVLISSLVRDESPRQSGESTDHIEVLAESEAQLPPIVVHGQSMRVIDGMHRIRAAVQRGEEKLRREYTTEQKTTHSC